MLKYPSSWPLPFSLSSIPAKPLDERRSPLIVYNFGVWQSKWGTARPPSAPPFSTWRSTAASAWCCSFSLRPIRRAAPRRPENFAAKYHLPFPLAPDPDHAIAEAYGVWKEKSMYGRKYMGIERTTFAIDEKGKIAKIFAKVKPEGHAAQVLEALGD